jgi:hypothetical protein
MKKRLFTFLSLAFIAMLYFVSCSESEQHKIFESKMIARKWKLSSDPNKKTPPSLLIISMHQNGYFQIYDSIVDTKFIDAGINKIQFISRGQYNFDGEKLLLNHFEEGSENKKETFKVTILTDKKMTLVSHDKKTRNYSVN